MTPLRGPKGAMNCGFCYKTADFCGKYSKSVGFASPLGQRHAVIYLQFSIIWEIFLKVIAKILSRAALVVVSPIFLSHILLEIAISLKHLRFFIAKIKNHADLLPFLAYFCLYK